MNVIRNMSFNQLSKGNKNDRLRINKLKLIDGRIKIFNNYYWTFFLLDEHLGYKYKS
jgi:hypothetical protein